ncbi:sugar kinase [Candidatus Woesearchaeota archaeon]|nr:sugar kinase [Candidatus Woesearchaeota archaeon]
MVNLVIVGTVGLDEVETPFGKKSDLLGGSATYAAYAASFFERPGMVAVVGKDFPEKHLSDFRKKGICTEGIKINHKTFRWSGYYEFDMNEAKTLRTELNCLENFDAKLPDKYKKAEYVFLANIDPDLQLQVIDQLENPRLIMLDTMNFWIEHKRDRLLEAIRKVDVFILNDGEARQLFNTPNLVKAANEALKMGPKAVIIKKGEHGALLFTDSKHFNAPGYPMEDIRDPTGCGDSFGGSLIGYLAKTKDHDEKNLRKGVVYASAIASFNAEGFGPGNLKALTEDMILKRYQEFKDMREF